MNKSRIIRHYYDDKQTKIKNKYFIFNGKIEGTHETFYSDGKIYQIHNYKNYNLEGESKQYFNNFIYIYYYCNNRCRKNKYYDIEQDLWINYV
jgi:antitoxin component YwqK of YwqJK toxin-antitoxin module